MNFFLFVSKYQIIDWKSRKFTEENSTTFQFLNNLLIQDNIIRLWENDTFFPDGIKREFIIVNSQSISHRK